MKIIFDEGIDNSAKELVSKQNRLALNGEKDAKIFLKNFWFKANLLSYLYGDTKDLKKDKELRVDSYGDSLFSIQINKYKLYFYGLEDNVIKFTNYTKA